MHDLDLSQAFDGVDRTDLLATLQKAEVDSDLQDLLAALHAGSRYGLRTNGVERMWNQPRGSNRAASSPPPCSRCSQAPKELTTLTKNLNKVRGRPHRSS